MAGNVPDMVSNFIASRDITFKNSIALETIVSLTLKPFKLF